MKTKVMLGLGVALFWVCVPPRPAAAAEKVTSVEAVKSDFEENLGLTPEQKEKTRLIRSAYRDKKRGLKEAAMARAEALRQELDAAVPDHARVDALVAELKSLAGQLIDARVEVVFKLREAYTPEQLKMIQEQPPQPAVEKAPKKPVKSGTKKTKKMTKGN